MRSFIIMKIVRMRAVFIVIALRPSETNETSFQSSVQGPQLCLCVTHSFAESWESRKARKKKKPERQRTERTAATLCSLSTSTRTAHNNWLSNFQTARDLICFPLRVRGPPRLELNFTQLLLFAFYAFLPFYEPHVDRKQIQMAMGIAIAIANGKCRRTNRDLSRKPSLISARQSRQQFFFIAS